MSRKDYLPSGLAERNLWFINFVTKLKTHEKTLGISAALMLVVVADGLAIAYTLNLVEAAKTSLDTVIAYRDALFSGVIGTTPAPFPVFTTPATPPAAVIPGIFPRTRQTIKMIKANPACTLAIQEDLGIVGEDITEDFDNVKLQLKAKFSGGKVNGKYIKKGATGALIESKRGDETEFSFFAVVTKASFTDKRPNLVAGKAENREYRGWLLLDDEKVGIISDVVSVAVGA